MYVGASTGYDMCGNSQNSFARCSFKRSYARLRQSDALQSSRSTMTYGMENWVRHAAVARPAGPAPTINTATFSIVKTRFGEVVGLGCGGRLGDSEQELDFGSRCWLDESVMK
jgi:hypothetical protein